MAFHLGFAYGVATLTTVALVLMGIRNRRAGWKKPKADNVLDIWIAWAQAQEQQRKGLQSVAQQPEAPPTSADISGQLESLNAVLSTGSGISPQPQVAAEHTKPARQPTAKV